MKNSRDSAAIGLAFVAFVLALAYIGILVYAGKQ